MDHDDGTDHDGPDHERAGSGDGSFDDPDYVEPAMAPAMGSESVPPPLGSPNNAGVPNYQAGMATQNNGYSRSGMSEDMQANYRGQGAMVAERSEKSDINPHTLTLPNLMVANYASVFDMERALAAHMKSWPLFRQNKMPRLILIGSWMPQEGKSFISQSIAHLATINAATAAIIKTPYNGEVERRAGIDLGQLQRPYDFIDPEAMSTNKQQSMVSFAGFKALLKASLQSYDVVVIDAATVQEEADFKALSSLADATLLLLDRPQQEGIPRVVERSIEAGLSKVQILLNRI